MDRPSKPVRRQPHRLGSVKLGRRELSDLNCALAKHIANEKEKEIDRGDVRSSLFGRRRVQGRNRRLSLCQLQPFMSRGQIENSQKKKKRFVLEVASVRHSPSLLSIHPFLPPSHFLIPPTTSPIHHPPTPFLLVSTSGVSRPFTSLQTPFPFAFLFINRFLFFVFPLSPCTTTPQKQNLSLMYSVGNFFSTVSKFYNEINPATLSGAIDIVVVQQANGDLACSPFHVRFGKLSVLRPQEKVVEVRVNGQAIAFPMKVGDAGEAFFVLETDDYVPDEFATSPIAGPSDEADLQPVDYFDLNGQQQQQQEGEEHDTFFFRLGACW